MLYVRRAKPGIITSLWLSQQTRCFFTGPFPLKTFSLSLILIKNLDLPLNCQLLFVHVIILLHPLH